MRELRVFTLPLDPRTGLFDDGPLREWLAVRELLRSRAAFFQRDGLPAWSIVVESRPLQGPGVKLAGARTSDAAQSKRDPAVSPAEHAERVAFQARLAELDELERARYDRLLVFRRDTARADGLPPYVLFTNQVALELARRAPGTLASLAEVRGIGRKRIDKHGHLILEPAWEARFIPHSYACRVGKGTHRAVLRARLLARRHPYYLRMDVRSYFDSVDHETLLRLLALRADDPGISWLCSKLLATARVPIASPGPNRGTAIPIGNLTSQFWANVYLDPLDHFAISALGASTWVRYMDDILVLADTKTALWEVAEAVQDFARDSLRLTMKRRATVVAPVSEGIPWLGHRVFPAMVRLDRTTRKRFARKLRTARDGMDDATQSSNAVCRLASLFGHVSHADSLALRRNADRSTFVSPARVAHPTASDYAHRIDA